MTKYSTIKISLIKMQFQIEEFCDSRCLTRVLKKVPFKMLQRKSRIVYSVLTCMTYQSIELLYDNTRNISKGKIILIEPTE